VHIFMSLIKVVLYTVLGLGVNHSGSHSTNYFRSFLINIFDFLTIRGDIMKLKTSSTGNISLALYLDKHTYGRGCHIVCFIQTI
jgi:hypothetical protein